MHPPPEKGEKMLKISWWDLGDDNHCVLCSRVQVLPSPSGSETNIFMVKQLVFKVRYSWGMRYKKQMLGYTWGKWIHGVHLHGGMQMGVREKELPKYLAWHAVTSRIDTVL